MTPLFGIKSACSEPVPSIALCAYADGELDPVHAAALTVHLRECSACSEQLHLLHAIRATLRRTGARAAPDRMKARAIAWIARERASGSPKPDSARPGFRFTYWPIAAGLFTAAASAVTLVALQRAPADPTESLLNQLVALHARPLPPETTDPNDLPRFDPVVGVPVREPVLRPRADFKGARLHAMQERRAALLQYTLPSNHRVTMYMFDPRALPVTNAPALRQRLIRDRSVYVGKIGGYSVAAAERGGVGYALATDLGADESAELVLDATQQ